jgi:hypothetical protein
MAGMSVYPNPATKTVSLMGINKISGSKNVCVRNILGAELMAQDFRDGQAVDMGVDALPAGTYVVQLSTDLGPASLSW